MMQSPQSPSPQFNGPQPQGPQPTDELHNWSPGCAMGPSAQEEIAQA